MVPLGGAPVAPVPGAASSGAGPSGLGPSGVTNPGKILLGFLVTFQNDSSGTFWPIYAGRITIGRSMGSSPAAVDVALPDASASARHASILGDGSTGQAFVEDEGSRNSTFLNDDKLTGGQRRQLRDSDRLRVGTTTFVVKLLVC